MYNHFLRRQSFCSMHLTFKHQAWCVQRHSHPTFNPCIVSLRLISEPKDVFLLFTQNSLGSQTRLHLPMSLTIVLLKSNVFPQSHDLHDSMETELTRFSDFCQSLEVQRRYSDVYFFFLPRSESSGKCCKASYSTVQLSNLCMVRTTKCLSPEIIARLLPEGHRRIGLGY